VQRRATVGLGTSSFAIVGNLKERFPRQIGMTGGDWCMDESDLHLFVTTVARRQRRALDGFLGCQADHPLQPASVLRIAN
jgi:hypothetical protein